MKLSESLKSPSETCREVLTTRIAESKPIAQNQWSVWLKADRELPDFLPGNFCMLTFPDFVDPLTPRPFAIVEKKGEMYHFIYRVTGKFTHLLATLSVGTKIGMMGPLGKGFSRDHFKKGKHVCISGGVGYASLLGLLDELAGAQNPPIGNFYGVRTDLEIIRRGKFKAEYTSDDGTAGIKGRLTELLKVRADVIKSADYFYICGPTLMMKAVYDFLPPEKSFYFLEETMGCGVGICIGCVVSISVGGEVKRVRSCLEGPIFSGDILTPWKEEKWQA